MERNNVCRIIFLSPIKLIQQYRRIFRFCVFLVTLNLSNDAKVLYALLFDRAGISRENGYIETDGTVRLYFIRRKQGLGRPAVITLKIPAAGKGN